MSESQQGTTAKRPREDHDAVPATAASVAESLPRSATVYVQCKHMAKPWDLLNDFLAHHREALGMGSWYEERKAKGGDADAPSTDDASAPGGYVLKVDAPIEISFAFWSRKPYFLVEFVGENRDAMATKLLNLPKGSTYRDAPVAISLARGTTVAQEKEKMHALGGVPHHAPTHPSSEGHRSTAPAPKPAVPETKRAELQPQRPSATSFVPRALWKRPST